MWGGRQVCNLERSVRDGDERVPVRRSQGRSGRSLLSGRGPSRSEGTKEGRAAQHVSQSRSGVHKVEPINLGEEFGFCFKGDRKPLEVFFCFCFLTEESCTMPAFFIFLF